MYLVKVTLPTGHYRRRVYVKRPKWFVEGIKENWLPPGVFWDRLYYGHAMLTPTTEMRVIDG